MSTHREPVTIHPLAEGGFLITTARFDGDRLSPISAHSTLDEALEAIRGRLFVPPQADPVKIGVSGDLEVDPMVPRRASPSFVPADGTYATPSAVGGPGLRRG